MSDTVQLTLYAAEAGGKAPAALFTSDGDLRNIHASSLYDASPDEFFSLYCAPRSIGSIHLRKDFFEVAIAFLKNHPEASLIASGLFSRARVVTLCEALNAAGISYRIIEKAQPRSARFIPAAAEASFTGEFLLNSGTLPRAISQSGVPQGESSASFWDAWFKDFYSEAFLAGLRIREERSFFSFLRETALYTGRPVNWFDIAKKADISQATVRRWSELIERLALIELIPTAKVEGKRRLAKREKLFWNAPGLALWLSREDLKDKECLKRYAMNLLFLALKDTHSKARFSYAFDTNKKEIPLLMETDGVKCGYYGVVSALDREKVRRNAQSFAKIAMVDRVALLELPELESEGAMSSFNIALFDLEVKKVQNEEKIGEKENA